MVQSPEQLSLAEAAALLAARKISAVELTKACLTRIAEREEIVGAWECVDATLALDQARERDRSHRSSPIHGIPIGVKDIVDTTNFPTAYGSSIYKGHRPTKNATCIERMLNAGAIILGKTVTTEFANRFPGKTINPRNPAHTPGGSSSGSAAAVADFMVPIALGTQTSGSIIRPAAYCGVVGYKPSYGTFSFAGIKPCAPSLDTLGLLCRSLADIDLTAGILAERPWAGSTINANGGVPSLAICRTPAWPHATEAAKLLLENLAAKLTRMNTTISSEWEAGGQLEGLIGAQRTIMAVETARSLANEYRAHREELSDSLRQLIERGNAEGDIALQQALSLVRCARSKWAEIFGEHDALVTLSTAGEAPIGLGSTGEPIFNSIWTALLFPCITLPGYIGQQGLPIGIQIVGKPGKDEALLATANWLWPRMRE
jgi:amidase